MYGRLANLFLERTFGMINVDAVTQTGGILYIDDKFFTHCRFENTQIIYAGGDYGWSETEFVNCPISFVGASLRTTTILASFGFKVEPTQTKVTQETAIGFKV